jgi:hypothetical protein
VRAWVENLKCVHVVMVNANTSHPAQCTVRLTGALSGLLTTAHAERLFDDVPRYMVLNNH